MNRRSLPLPYVVLAVGLLLVVAAGGQQTVADADATSAGISPWHQIERISVTSTGEEVAIDSHPGAISDDGRLVVFTNRTWELVPGDTNGWRDVFVRDRATATTERVSVNSSGDEGNSSSGDRCTSISGDGRFVAFDSLATNLVEGDTNGISDLFIHDRVTGTTERVSVNSSGQEADGSAMGVSVNGDGRYIAFDSSAQNLVDNDANGSYDVFVHDRVTGTTERVSVGRFGEEANGPSLSPSITGDGRYVAFHSEASNLIDGDTNGSYDVFVHDRMTGTTERVSVNSSGDEAGSGRFASISDDGRYVAFLSGADDLVIGDTNSRDDVFVHDRLSGTTELVSISSTGDQANDMSSTPSICGDGRYVAFSSPATNLVSNDENDFSDVFVRDLVRDTTVRVSIGFAGEEADSWSEGARMSGDGRHLSLVSYASNLVAGDTNNRGDVFSADFAMFDDIEQSVFEADIEWLAAEGITKGCNPPLNTMYCPDDSVTRGQMAAFLVRALNLTDDGEGNLFTDDDGSVFESSIDKLATAGITKGCNPPDNTMFCPNDNVTRGQMAAFLVRALGYTHDGGGNLFTDDNGNIFETSIDKLATAGVTRGCNPPVNDMFCPHSHVTRGQMAAFLHRALG